MALLSDNRNVIEPWFLDLHLQLKIMRIKILENDTIDMKDKTISINHKP